MVDYETVAYATGLLGGILTIADSLSGIWIPFYVSSIMSMIPIASLFSGFVFSGATVLKSLIPIVLGFVSFLGCRFLSNGEYGRAVTVFLTIGVILLTLAILSFWLPVEGDVLGGIVLIAAGIIGYKL